MPTNRVPSYRRHATGQGVVRLNGRDVYLGRFGTPESRRRYARLIADWEANGRQLAAGDDLTIAELVDRFWTHAQAYYRHDDAERTPTGEHHGYRQALRPLLELFGDDKCLAREFGPRALRTVQHEMIKLGWARVTINKNVGRIRRMFRWAVENEMVPAIVYGALLTVQGLRAGRSEARETDSIRPVPQAWVDAALPALSSQVQAMIRLQLLTGMRPGEVVLMRPCDINTTGPIWVYVPSQHKTKHRGFAREVYLGPRAQEILKPFLMRKTDARCFSSAEAETDRRAARHEARQTPLNFGNVPGSNCARRPKRQPRGFYTTDSYRRAIARACEIAFDMPAELQEPRAAAERKAESELPAEVQERRRQQRSKQRGEWREQHTWHPNQLRHNFATEVRRMHGLEPAQVLLGHQSADVTQIYAEADRARAERIISEIG